MRELADLKAHRLVDRRRRRVREQGTDGMMRNGPHHVLQQLQAEPGYARVLTHFPGREPEDVVALKRRIEARGVDETEDAQNRVVGAAARADERVATGVAVLPVEQRSASGQDV